MKRRARLSTTQMIVLSFLYTILTGAVLLWLPISSADGSFTPFVDALFTSATSVCVTGLVVVTTATHWSLFGQIVILLLIQIGGLGIITITTALLLALGRKITLRDRVLLEDAFNLSTLSGLISFLRRVLAGTFLIEFVGMLLCLPVFVPLYGGKGIWYSLFHSVSSFCNAGLDILGPDSLIPFSGDVWLNLVTMALIVLGGIGTVVWWDVLGTLRGVFSGRIPRRRLFGSLSLHTRIVLIMTGALIFGGAFLFLLFEYNNPGTIGDMPFGEKLLACLFQSVTSRTAGFATISQKALTPASALLSMLLFFIGGSPIGTAGGVKTTTFAIFLLSVAATVRGRPEVTVMQRTVVQETVRKAIAVMCIFFAVCIVAIVLLLCFTGGSALDICFEVFSAAGTVGLSRDYTVAMNTVGKLIVTACMYLGRIGPISLILALSHKDNNPPMRYAEGSVIVG